MANTMNYETPSASGAVPPTALVMSRKSIASAIVTGDGATLTITFTHNMNISAAQLLLGFPQVEYEQLLAAGYTAAPVITAKTANAVTFSCTAFTGAGLRIRISRPLSMTE
jgi:hypothetical protein